MITGEQCHLDRDRDGYHDCDEYTYCRGCPYLWDDDDWWDENGGCDD